jgi:hypothetical protein
VKGLGILCRHVELEQGGHMFAVAVERSCWSDTGTADLGKGVSSEDRRALIESILGCINRVSGHT